MEYLTKTLLLPTTGKAIDVLDIGSMVAQEGQSSYRDVFDRFTGVRYVGLDMAPGRNVDIVAKDPYKFPLESESFDLVVSGQAFEHIEFPWLTISEIARVLKPGGLAIVIAPSSGPEHRYPQDCWRYYPDGMRALGKWAGLECIHAITNWNETKRFLWGDTIGVFCKISDGQVVGNSSTSNKEIAADLEKIWADLLPSAKDYRNTISRRISSALDRHILWRFKK